MRIIEGAAFIEWQELLACGIPEGTIRAATQRNSVGWVTIKDPSDSRKVLISFDSLKDKYKNMVRLCLGDPNEANKASVLDNYMISSTEDIDFLQHFKLSDGRKLPAATLNEYINACKVLRFLATYSDRSCANNIGFSSLGAFWAAVSSYIILNKVRLPKDRNKLQAKLQEYQKQGTSCIISSKFCNKNSQKVSNEVCAALLLQLIGHHNQFEYVFVAQKYNLWAKENGYKSITPATVGNYAHKHAVETTNSRQGSAVWRNLYDKSVHQDRPSAPLLLVNSDDNVLDLYFIKETTNKKGHKLHDYYHRFTLLVVMDAYNDYPLGYAIGEAQTTDLVKEAYLNATHHVKELTGGHFLWHQIKADSWGLKQLKPWYEAQAQFTPPRTGNARGKVIEQSFGNNWHRLLKQYPNYAGHNITAAERLNPDAIQRIKKDFPTVDQAPAIIADFINRLRNQVIEKKQLTRQQMWIQGWNQLQEGSRRQLTDQNRLMLFGKRHEYTNTITKDGLAVTLNGERIFFDVPSSEYAKHVGRKFNVAYDPYDLTSVVAYSNDSSIQIHCPVFEKHKMAIADMTTGDRARLNVILDEKRSLSQWVLNAEADRRELLERNNIDAESMLQAGVLVKELKSSAEDTYMRKQLQSYQNDDPFDDMPLPEPLNLNDIPEDED